MKVFTKIRYWLLVLLATFVWGGGVQAAPAPAHETFGSRRWWLPENVFPAADQIDVLFNIILVLTSIVCVAVFAVMLVFLIRYRARAGRHATYIQGNIRLEAVWTLVPTLILALIAAFSQATWSNIKQMPEVGPQDGAIEMEIIAKQFAWYYHYAGADGKLGLRRSDLVDLNASEPDAIIGLDRSNPDAQDDIVSTVMAVPVNTKVLIKLNSVDVLHSFFLPHFRVKQDAIPGMATSVWIESTRTSGQTIGTSPDEQDMFGYAKPFDIVCAELCGQGHFTMRGKLYVVNRQQYEAFLEEEASYLDFGDDEEDEY